MSMPELGHGTTAPWCHGGGQSSVPCGQQLLGKARCGSVPRGRGPKGRGKPGSLQQSELLLRDTPLGPRSALAEQARLDTHRRVISSPLTLPAPGMEDRGFILFGLNCPGLNSSVGSSCPLGQRVI